MKYASHHAKLARLVAPCAGAWIEIRNGHRRYRCAWSPPARGRGLK